MLVHGEVPGSFRPFCPSLLWEKKDEYQSNQFYAGAWTQVAADWSHKPRFLLGKNSVITLEHYSDFAASIVAGDHSTIAGYGSQFWTHGPDIGCKDIQIGNDCYFGCAVRFFPGSADGNRVLVATGSILIDRIEVDDAMIAGMPAKMKKEGYDWRNKPYLRRRSGKERSSFWCW